MKIFSPRYWVWPKISLKLDQEVRTALDAGDVPTVIDAEGTIKLGEVLLMRTSGFSNAYFLVGTVKMKDDLMIFAEPDGLHWIGRSTARRLVELITGS